VRLTPHAAKPIECSNDKLLRQLVKAGFRQRRKMLKNNLGFLRLPAEQISEIFRELNFDPQVRAERLSLKQFALLADICSQSKYSPDGVEKGTPSTV
jgi:16S rRNA (adenine1518-N6/adenine1519-N6)-dimethyltransferase